MNQKGLSSLLLLIMLVLGVFIIWESNEFFNHYSNIQQGESQSGKAAGDQEPVCLTGEASNCNDSNDVFLLPE